MGPVQKYKAVHKVCSGIIKSNTLNVQGINSSHHTYKYYTCNRLLQPCESEDGRREQCGARALFSFNISSVYCCHPMFARAVVIFVQIRDSCVVLSISANIHSTITELLTALLVNDEHLFVALKFARTSGITHPQHRFPVPKQRSHEEFHIWMLQDHAPIFLTSRRLSTKTTKCFWFMNKQTAPKLMQ